MVTQLNCREQPRRVTAAPQPRLPFLLLICCCGHYGWRWVSWWWCSWTQRVGKVRKMGRLVSQSSCRLPDLSSVLSWCRSSLHIQTVRVLSDTVLRHAFLLFSFNSHSSIHSFTLSFIHLGLFKCHITCAEVKGKSGCSLVLPCGFWGLNSGYQPCQQAPLYAKPSCWPLFTLLMAPID